MQKWTLIAGIFTVALFGAVHAAQTSAVSVDTSTKVEASTQEQSLARRCNHGRGVRRVGGRRC